MLQAILKKDNDMKIDKATYKDKEKRKIGMAADHTSRRDKVLFFADTHYTWASRISRHTDQNLLKSAILPTLPN